MHRRTFLTATSAVMAFGAGGLRPADAAPVAERDVETLALLTVAADRLTEAALAAPRAQGFGGARGVLRQMRRLITSFVWKESRYFEAEALISPIQDLLGRVEAAQHDDGTFSGGNRHSPPDSAFLIEDMATVLGALKTSQHALSQDVAARLVVMMRKAGPPLRTGGIHTPNHRWELSAALSKIDKVDPHPAYRVRIDEWLAEGVDINAEGFYSEQSSNYAQAVSNPSLLRLAHLPGREGLRALVRRNLETTIDLSEPFYGDVETILSRRQDQAQTKQTLHGYYLQFRELAQRDNDARFAGVVRWIEQNDASELGDALTDILDQPELAGPIPAPIMPFIDLQRRFETVNLVRERLGDRTASFFAGSDWFADGEPSPFYNVIGSGLATNPTLVRMWKAGLVIDAIRLIPNFFSMGHWRPSAVEMDAGGVVRLSGEMKVPYYLPMPAERRIPDGAYALSRSVDGRFNSALDFSHRPAQFRVLNLSMVAAPDATGYDLLFKVDGEDDVEVSIEITLRDGGRLEGGRSMEDGSVHLIDGHATYVVGEDRLIIGPGNGDTPVILSSGEQYSWARGQLQLPGKRLYVTGRAPMEHVIRLTFT